MTFGRRERAVRLLPSHLRRSDHERVGNHAIQRNSRRTAWPNECRYDKASTRCSGPWSGPTPAPSVRGGKPSCARARRPALGPDEPADKRPLIPLSHCAIRATNCPPDGRPSPGTERVAPAHSMWTQAARRGNRILSLPSRQPLRQQRALRALHIDEHRNTEACLPFCCGVTRVVTGGLSSPASVTVGSVAPRPRLLAWYGGSAGRLKTPVPEEYS